MPETKICIHFSDYFGISSDDLEAAGAFNVSLINDLPLFIDPFLLFNSTKPEYQALHERVITYLRFLRDKSINGDVNTGLLMAWFKFSEVRQTWLGFSVVGNSGSGLGMGFARALRDNLNTVFRTFGKEQIAHGSHLEKLCLIGEGVGRDSISDFTTNLVKEYLLDYTQHFARQHIAPHLRSPFTIGRVRFNYQTETWESRSYELPCLGSDYVLLTPMDMLTKDDIWINRADLIEQFRGIVNSVQNEQLRAELNNYLLAEIPRDATPKERNAAVGRMYRLHPELLEYYIRHKEDHGDEAEAISEVRVAESKWLFIRQAREFVDALCNKTSFYASDGDTLEEARARVMHMKHVIEDQDGYRLFYDASGQAIRRERDVQLLFKLTWFASNADMSSEVNNGRGSVDFKISRGAYDKSLIEFKLASNTSLERNLKTQVAIYQQANDTQKALRVVIYFSEHELRRVQRILSSLRMAADPDVILIDARRDNKPSASVAATPK